MLNVYSTRSHDTAARTVSQFACIMVVRCWQHLMSDSDDNALHQYAVQGTACQFASALRCLPRYPSAAKEMCCCSRADLYLQSDLKLPNMQPTDSSIGHVSRGCQWKLRYIVPKLIMVADCISRATCVCNLCCCKYGSILLMACMQLCGSHLAIV